MPTCHDTQDSPQCQPATMPPTTRPAAMPTCCDANLPHQQQDPPQHYPLYAQDLPQCHHDEGYHNHISEDGNSNDNGAGDDGGRDSSSRCGNGSGLTCIYFNL